MTMNKITDASTLSPAMPAKTAAMTRMMTIKSLNSSKNCMISGFLFLTLSRFRPYFFWRFLMSADLRPFRLVSKSFRSCVCVLRCIGFRIWNIECGMSNVECRMWNMECRMSDFGCEIWNAGVRMYGYWPPGGFCTMIIYHNAVATRRRRVL